jgi:glycosyltransferase involved in cell wall biosynthesis
MTNTLEVGGSERQFVELAVGLDQERIDVRSACLRRVGGLATRLGEIPEFPPGGSLFRLQSQKARAAMVRYMREHETQVAHAFDFYTNVMMAPAARFGRVPVVLGSHRQIGDLLTPAQFRVQMMAFRLCDRVVCNSQAAAARLRQSGLKDRKLVIIPNGLSDELFQNIVPAIPKTAGSVRIGMIARMNDPVKNHEAFLKAAAKVAKKSEVAEFILVGDGPLRPGLQKLAGDFGISERVMFLGERHDIPPVLASLDVSVLISKSESLSNVVLESMAAGLPVIATRVGGNPELVQAGETGLLIEPNDEQQLVNALFELISDSGLRSKLGEKAKAFARSRFHISEIAHQYETLYANLLEEKSK